MGNPFILFQNKIKNVKNVLTVWSKEIFSDKFKQITTMEDVKKGMK